MRAALLAVCMVVCNASAQEASSGFEVRVTASALAVGSESLTEAPRNGAPAAAGFRLVAYPTWKLSEHWSITAAVQVNSRPYFYEDFYTTGYRIRTDILQASMSYSTFWKGSNALVIRAGQLPSAFGSFLLRYDDASNPLIDKPLSYGYYYTGVTTQGLPGAEADLTVGRMDLRAQFTNSSPANPHSLLDKNQYGGWTGGAGYTVQQGFRVGVSAYRGPYLDDDDIHGRENARKLPATGYGVDLQWGRGPWNVNAELQRFQWVNQVEPGTNQRVGYGEVRRVLGPRWYVAARWSVLRRDEYSNSQVWETAVGYRPGTHELVKAGYELMRRANETEQVVAVQFVTQFRPVSLGRD